MKKQTTQKLVIVALMSGVAFLLMMVHLPYKFLGFLEFEISDVPAVVTGFAFGPLYGVLVELIKNAFKLMTTTTAGVGEVANFIICSAYVVPASFIFRKMKGSEIKRNIVSLSIGTICFAFAGIVVNYFVTVPLYIRVFFGGNEAALFGMAGATIPAIKNAATLVVLGITPFNIVKGILIAVLSALVYKAVKKVLRQ